MKPDHRPPKSQTPSIAFPTEDCKNCQGVALKSQRLQLALRISVASTGPGCSITSAATVSTTRAAGCFTFRATFLTGAALGLALATARFAVLATLRALLRLAEFALRCLARVCTFAAFLRLAMISPFVSSCVNQRIDAARPSPGNHTIELSTGRVVSVPSSPLYL